ncbi:hypothetical protein Tco_1277469 [Tanacetum coccineum]
MGDDVDISMLTMEQYLALIRDNVRPGVVKPEIGNDVKFVISIQFMKELRRNLFAGTDDEDAHEHVQSVLEIADLFHTPGVTHDAKMLRVFLVTLTKSARRWEKRLTARVINTCDLLEKAFIRQCLQHDLNSHQKVQIFYTILDIPARIMLDSKEFIPLMTPTQALDSIQIMADHNIIGMMEQPLGKEPTIAWITLIRRNLRRIFMLFEEVVRFVKRSI